MPATAHSGSSWSGVDDFAAANATDTRKVLRALRATHARIIAEERATAVNKGKIRVLEVREHRIKSEQQAREALQLRAREAGAARAAAKAAEAEVRAREAQRLTGLHAKKRADRRAVQARLAKMSDRMSKSAGGGGPPTSSSPPLPSESTPGKAAAASSAPNVFRADFSAADRPRADSGAGSMMKELRLHRELANEVRLRDEANRTGSLTKTQETTKLGPVQQRAVEVRRELRFMHRRVLASSDRLLSSQSEMERAAFSSSSARPSSPPSSPYSLVSKRGKASPLHPGRTAAGNKGAAATGLATGSGLVTSTPRTAMARTSHGRALSFTSEPGSPK